MRSPQLKKGILVKVGLILAAGTLVLSSFACFDVPAGTLDLGNGKPPVKLPENSPALTLQSAFINVASSVSPAVVNISSEWTENVRGFGDMDDFFNFWFYGPQGGPRRHPPLQQKQKSLGSGFLITADGYILTNKHVLGKAEKVTVTFRDGTVHKAKVVGRAEGVDIGVVKIEEKKKDFPHVVLGDSDAIQVGEWAIAIGNPFALDHTVTTGIISAKGRSVALSQETGYQSYIQTDASINPGNSGGPLCNINGEVVGINTAIYSQSGGSVGIGFAIPSNIARKAAEDLVNEGKVIRAGLGAMVQDLTPPMAKSFGLSSTDGALLSDINAGSAAEKAGLKPGDIVLALDGVKVTGSGDLISKLYTKKPGTKVEVTYSREGREAKVQVTLQTLSSKETGKSEEAEEEGAGPSDNSNLGIAFLDPSEELQQRLPANAPKGPVITRVQRGSAAAAAGIKSGDIVLKAGNTLIRSADELAKVIEKTDMAKGLRLFVWRDGSTYYTYLQSDGN